MSLCPHCRNADRFFDERLARRDLRRLRTRGPTTTTRRLAELIASSLPLAEATLVEFGGGVGPLHHTLLARGLARATVVDASRAFLAAADEEAHRRGHTDRVAYRFGDAVDLAPELPRATVVALDRVLCCYPDPEALLGAADRLAERLIGLVYPPRRWWGVPLIAVLRGCTRLIGKPFDFFLWPAERIEGILVGRGWRNRVREQRDPFWRIELWERAA